MTKAKYIGSTQSMDKNYLNMHFEYRGENYIVVRALSWTACSSDYTSRNGSRAEWRQHKEAQESIDAKLDHPREEPKPYTGPTLDEIFELMEVE